jgi:hypothetical protein
VGARLGNVQPRVAFPARPVLAADLEHVGIGPAAGAGEVGLGVLHGGGEVADDRGVARADVAGGAVQVPRAPRRVGLERDLAPPVAVLYGDRLAAVALNQVVPQLHIRLRAAPVELPRVETARGGGAGRRE